MKKTSFFYLSFLMSSLLVPKNSSAQNIVPNPGFELFDSLPCNFIQSNIEFSQYIQNWFLPTGGTSDIISTQIPGTCNYGNPLSFNSCGPQYARSGDAMVGMVAGSFSWWNEYVEVQLNTPLTTGKRYYFECYILCGICANFASNNFGASLSENLYADTSSVSYINLQPVVLDSALQNNTQQWEKISGCFLADSAYQFLILGHFENNCDTSAVSIGSWPTAYYFLDDVYLAEDSTCELTGSSCMLADQISNATNNELVSHVESGQLKLALKNFIGTVSIFSIDGKKITTNVPFENSATVDLHSFAQGMYVGILSDQRQHTLYRFKFVKN